MSYGTRSGITYGLGASTGEHKGDSSDTGDLSESFDRVQKVIMWRW